MNIIETNITDLLIIEPNVFEDARGYFFESYNKALYEKNGLNYDFVQDNQSKSSYGVIRGLHFQKGEYAQTKLVSVVEGEILDVAVDIRKDSKTYGQYFSVILSANNKRRFLIPCGFAHGFSVLSQIAIVQYKCDNFYNKNAETGIIFNDKFLNIDWKIPAEKQIISEKDSKLPKFVK